MLSYYLCASLGSLVCILLILIQRPLSPIQWLEWIIMRLKLRIKCRAFAPLSPTWARVKVIIRRKFCVILIQENTFFQLMALHIDSDKTIAVVSANTLALYINTNAYLLHGREYYYYFHLVACVPSTSLY